MTNILEEYLIKLGFSTDEPSFRKLADTMASAERSVVDHSRGMAKSVIEAQAAIGGAFLSIGAGIVGTVDKVAMADQSYRLLGLRMLMTTESARKMDIITHALGASLQEIVWDPELHARAVIMGQDIDRMTKALGPGFEKNMLGIRNVRMEFSRLEVAMQFLGMQFVSDLFKKLNIGDFGTRVEGLVIWFEQHIPELSDKLTSYAIPALEKTWEILKELGKVGQAFGVMFTNVVGLLSGDNAIESSSFSFDKLAKAIEHVGDWMIKFFGWISHAEELLAHFASAMSLVIAGKFAEAKDEFKAGMADLTGGSGATIGAVVGSAFGPVGTAVGSVIGGAAGKAREQFMPEPVAPGTAAAQPQVVPTLAQDVTNKYSSIEKHIQDQYQQYGKIGGTIGLVGDAIKGTIDAVAGLVGLARKAVPESPAPPAIPSVIPAPTIEPEFAPPATPFRLVPQSSVTPPSVAPKFTTPAGGMSRTDIESAIIAASARYHVPPSLALSVAQEESSMRQDVKGDPTSTGRAVGLFQLMPATAKTMGVDASDTMGNIEGGVKFLGSLLERYKGDTYKALAAYGSGPARAEKGNFQDLTDETRKAIPKILGFQQSFEAQLANRGKRDESDAAAIAGPSSELIMPPAPDKVPLWMNEAPAWHSQLFSGLNQDSDKKTAGIANRDWTAANNYLQRPIAHPANVMHSESNMDVGGISVYITQPGADAAQIQKAVTRGVRDGLQNQTQHDLVQLSPAW